LLQIFFDPTVGLGPRQKIIAPSCLVFGPSAFVALKMNQIPAQYGTIIFAEALIAVALAHQGNFAFGWDYIHCIRIHRRMHLPFEL
jgi:hypothetical protein